MDAKAKGPFTLPKLPWAEDALAPVISARTIQLHHGKHHKAYVDKLNELVAGTRFADMPLEQVVRASAGEQEKKVFNNAAQAWNHTFFWSCLRAGGSKPSGDLAQRLEADLGGAEAFGKDFAKAAVECFGSGWAWLVERAGKLEIVSTSNAGTPLTTGGATPLLTLDVWEHAYYVDYENRRPEYVEAVIKKLLNWEFAAQQLDAAHHRKAA
jgi:Fe-Mn family superoxide dismutase